MESTLGGRRLWFVENLQRFANDCGGDFHGLQGKSIKGEVSVRNMDYSRFFKLLNYTPLTLFHLMTHDFNDRS